MATPANSINRLGLRRAGEGAPETTVGAPADEFRTSAGDFSGDETGFDLFAAPSSRPGREMFSGAERPSSLASISVPPLPHFGGAQSRQRIVQSERVSISADRFSQIGDGGLLGLSFAVCRNVRQSRSVAALLWIGDQFDDHGHIRSFLIREF
jgi:hypothetical protein